MFTRKQTQMGVSTHLSLCLTYVSLEPSAGFSPRIANIL